MRNTIQVKMNTNKDEYGFYSYEVRVYINGQPTRYKREWQSFTKALENVGFLELFYQTFNERYELLESCV